MGRKIILPVIRQKGESQNGGNKKTKRAKFPEKLSFRELETNVSGGEQKSFFRKIRRALFSFTSVLRLAFLSYYRQYMMHCAISYHSYSLKNVKTQ